MTRIFVGLGKQDGLRPGELRPGELVAVIATAKLRLLGVGLAYDCNPETDGDCRQQRGPNYQSSR